MRNISYYQHSLFLPLMSRQSQTTLFFHPNLEQSHIELPPDEAKHIKTLRLRKGDRIWLVDGNGNRAEGVIQSPAVKDCHIEIVERQPPTPAKPYTIHIALAPTKSNDRIEWFLEKAIEIGIDKVTLMETEHGIRSKLKGDRLWRKGLAAMKQSLRAEMPEVEALIPFREVLEQSQAEECFIAYTPESPERHLQKVATPGKSYLVLIGPEGGFSEEELKLATQKGYRAVSLGASRLRTETAALVSCMLLNFINQE